MAAPTIDLDALRAAPVTHDPFPYLIVPGFVRREALAAIEEDYPKIEQPGSFPLPAVTYGDSFRQLIEDIRGPEMTAAIADKFAVDLKNRPTMVTVRGHTDANDGQIHTDSKTKLVTVLLYMNGTCCARLTTSTTWSPKCRRTKAPYWLSGTSPTHGTGTKFTKARAARSSSTGCATRESSAASNGGIASVRW